MRLADKWKDFEVIDTSSGDKLERWGDVILIRPDPQVIWQTPKNSAWNNANAEYIRSSTGGGYWNEKKMPKKEWTVSYKNLRFSIKPTGFKHTGLFPEQAVNWDFMSEQIKAAWREIKVLNLFAYTGGATLACAEAGASVCHVDASKGMVAWARENAKLSGLEQKPIRWIVDDCKKFVEREIRRGSRYDAIVMDPPSYGRGPNGEIWKLEDSVYSLVELCAGVLSENPLFFVLNSYTTGLSASVMEYILGVILKDKYGGEILSSEIGLPVTNSGYALPCGCTAIWGKSIKNMQK
ncbi:MAG TPA: SAM-dependent methyltransferase [Ruminococcaceae bacterium]|nr:SAM-dependent methyltransferase [Oscillospiraceae bacterium]